MVGENSLFDEVQMYLFKQGLVLPLIPTVYMLVSPVVNMSHQYVKLMRLIKARL